MASPAIISQVLTEVASRFERTKAARTGTAVRSCLMDYEDLLQSAGCKDGEERRLAERDLETAEKQGVWRLSDTGERAFASKFA